MRKCYLLHDMFFLVNGTGAVQARNDGIDHGAPTDPVLPPVDELIVGIKVFVIGLNNDRADGEKH